MVDIGTYKIPEIQKQCAKIKDELEAIDYKKTMAKYELQNMNNRLTILNSISYKKRNEIEYLHRHQHIKFLTAQSQTYLNDLAKSTLPFMYQTSIEGIRSILKECWNIYQSDDSKINWFQRLSALKLAKECHESIFHLVDEGPSIMYLKQLQERLAQIESR